MCDTCSECNCIIFCGLGMGCKDGMACKCDCHAFDARTPLEIVETHKQANPDTWEDKVMEDNSKWMNPPLGFQEVKQLLASIGKRGYDKYRCKEQPICGVCNAAKCRTKK